MCISRGCNAFPAKKIRFGAGFGWSCGSQSPRFHLNSQLAAAHSWRITALPGEAFPLRCSRGPSLPSRPRLSPAASSLYPGCGGYSSLSTQCPHSSINSRKCQEKPRLNRDSDGVLFLQPSEIPIPPVGRRLPPSGFWMVMTAMPSSRAAIQIDPPAAPIRPSLAKRSERSCV